ncbi:hypothetical protein IGI39_001166 [Enterococcus sp. AZ135]|uniref:hypothetical protein n=1 Tax=unclassified Enterococcus TaxID=2608891 RepID=UPI003F26FDF6
MDELSKLDRDYREILKKKNRYYLVVIILLLICTGILLVGSNWFELKINEHASGFLTGMFSSICLIFALFIFKNHRIMDNPKLLKEYRIARTDERNLEIVSMTLRSSAYVMVVVLLILSVVGSFVSRILMLTASGLLYVFLISYLISYFYFRKKL